MKTGSAAQGRSCTGDLMLLEVVDEDGGTNAIHERQPLEAVPRLDGVLQALQAMG